MDFNRYFTNEELKSLLHKWAEAYPSLVTLSKIGTSYQGQPIWLLTLTNQTTGSDTEKPAVWVDANIHATELAGTVTVLHLVDTLLTSYGQDTRITTLLDTSTFYAVPRINPDGAALAMAAVPRLRSGVRPYPWEEQTEGLHMQDIDGDRRILQMRIPDPNGDWKISSLDPRLMQKRGLDEHGGIYYRLLPEGLIHNIDGRRSCPQYPFCDRTWRDAASSGHPHIRGIPVGRQHLSTQFSGGKYRLLAHLHESTGQKTSGSPTCMG